MAQEVMALAARSDHMISVRGTYVVKGEKRLLQVIL